VEFEIGSAQAERTQLAIQKGLQTTLEEPGVVLMDGQTSQDEDGATGMSARFVQEEQVHAVHPTCN